jgi:DNA-binding NarL/FixJ family response regulator
MIRVAIVEDNRAYSEALRRTFAVVQDLEILGCWESAESFLAALESLEHTPDVTIVDIGLPGISGVECAFRLKQHATPTEIVMCTQHDDEGLVFKALQAGACGYILKSDGAEAIVSAVRSASEGGTPLTRRIARIVLGYFSKQEHAFRNEALLSAREKDVLQFLADGKSYKEISAALFLSIHTTRSHVQSIYRKLQVHSRAEIMRMLKLS